MKSKKIKDFQKTILDHWKKEGRHALPWRKTHDPYKILVSEVMLQQTQVDRVIPYYRAFLKKFPTVRALAQAELHDVLRLWSGLGYNRRAKYLHEAAKAIEINHKGRFPRSYDALRTLPGVGEYTARAVRTFALNQPGVFIETNIRTVFMHAFHAVISKNEKTSDADLMPLITKAAEGQIPREWYWALMDYGAYLKHSGIRINSKSKHYIKQSKFQGSQRQVRGAILRAYLDKKELKAVKKRYANLYDSAFIALKAEGLIE